MVTLASPHVFLVFQQVFGVLDSPEYSGGTPGVHRPVINHGRDEQANLVSDSSTTDAGRGSTPPATSSHPTGQMQVNRGAEAPSINVELHLLPLHACVVFIPLLLLVHILLSSFAIDHIPLIFRVQMVQVWKDQSGFPVGLVWQTAMPTLVPLQLKRTVWKVL